MAFECYMKYRAGGALLNLSDNCSVDGDKLSP